MTDRIAGFVVTLEADQREDDAQATIAALRMIRGVVSVKPVVADVEMMLARAQVVNEMSGRLWKALRDEE